MTEHHTSNISEITSTSHLLNLPQPSQFRNLGGVKLEFELYEAGPRDVLRAVLVSCVESCIVSWRFVRSLGFGSTPSLKDKCPYYKTALRRSRKIVFNRDLQWLLRASSTPSSAPGPSSPQAAVPCLGSSASKGRAPGKPRPRPRFWRDAFGPSLVMPLNFFLGWLLINADLINIRL